MIGDEVYCFFVYVDIVDVVLLVLCCGIDIGCGIDFCLVLLIVNVDIVDDWWVCLFDCYVVEVGDF